VRGGVWDGTDSGDRHEVDPLDETSRAREVKREPDPCPQSRQLTVRVTDGGQDPTAIAHSVAANF
jgi:hypothetical protein